MTLTELELFVTEKDMPVIPCDFDGTKATWFSIEHDVCPCGSGPYFWCKECHDLAIEQWNLEQILECTICSTVLFSSYNKVIIRFEKI